MVPWQPAPAGTVRPGGQVVMVGATVSTTVTVVVQVLELPAASVTVTVTVCGPMPTIAPKAGLCVFNRLPPGVQLSEATTPVSTLGIAAWQPAPDDTVEFEGQVTIGAVLSITVMVAVHVDDLLARSGFDG